MTHVTSSPVASYVILDPAVLQYKPMTRCKVTYIVNKFLDLNTCHFWANKLIQAQISWTRESKRNPAKGYLDWKQYSHAILRVISGSLGFPLSNTADFSKSKFCCSTVTFITTCKPALPIEVYSSILRKNKRSCYVGLQDVHTVNKFSV